MTTSPLFFCLKYVCTRSRPYWILNAFTDLPLLHLLACIVLHHDDVIKWKHFPRCWSFVWGFHRSPVKSLYKDQWRGELMFSLSCAWINGWVNNHEVSDLRHHHAHYDGTVMWNHFVKSFVDQTSFYEIILPHNAVVCWKSDLRVKSFTLRTMESSSETQHSWWYIWASDKHINTGEWVLLWIEIAVCQSTDCL